MPCVSNADCIVVGAGTCTSENADCASNDPSNCNFVQRCDLVQLMGWPCDKDGVFCTLDLCEDDGTGSGNSVCEEQDDGVGPNPTLLSPCAKQCVGGSAQNRRCDRPGDCPQGACRIKPDGLCDDTTAACYVGTSVAGAIGRCCAARQANAFRTPLSRGNGTVLGFKRSHCRQRGRSV